MLGATDAAIRKVAHRHGISLVSDWAEEYTVNCACGASFVVTRRRARAHRVTMCDPCRGRAWRNSHDHKVVPAQKKMLYSARKRAHLRGIPFNITEADIVIPATCPVLGIPLSRVVDGGPGVGPQPSSPTLDRIIPELGYVPGNVAVISWRANKLKSDATLAELEAVTAWVKSITP